MGQQLTLDGLAECLGVFAELHETLRRNRDEFIPSECVEPVAIQSQLAQVAFQTLAFVLFVYEILIVAAPSCSVLLQLGGGSPPWYPPFLRIACEALLL